MANIVHTVLLTLHALAGTVGLVLGPVVAVRETRRLRAGVPHREDRPAALGARHDHRYVAHRGVAAAPHAGVDPGPGEFVV